MRRGRKWVATAILIIIQIAFIRAGRQIWGPGRSGPAGPAAAEGVSEAPAKSLGWPDAPVEIIEYTDFQCPACTAGARVVHDAFERYPEKIYLEYRHYPIPGLHPRAVRIAVYAQCAARQGRFWPYHDLLFEYRRELMRYPDFEDKLRDLASWEGLDLPKLEACVRDTRTEEAVLAEKREGRRRGVRATPTYFINGEMVVGARSLGGKLMEIFGAEDPAPDNQGGPPS